MRGHSVTFSGLLATARYGELIKMQHSCYHVDIILHANSSYVTTKLYGTSTCRCNNNTIFSERAIFTFPTDVCWPRWPGSGEALMIHAIVEKWQYCSVLNSLFSVFKISFLPKYRVKCYDFIVKWCSGI